MLQRISRWLVVALLVVPGLVLAAGPDIKLQDVEGKEHNVNEYIGQGKWTVVGAPVFVVLLRRFRGGYEV